jgi:hypothetical protein
MPGVNLVRMALHDIKIKDIHNNLKYSTHMMKKGEIESLEK